MGIFARLKASFQGKEDADRYLKGLDKSKKSFGERLRRLASGFRGVDEDFLEEVMVILLEADVGIHTAEKITSRLESEAARQKLKTFDEISECLVSVMLDMYNEHEDAPVRTNEDGPTVILMVGVNGSGKTTTAAKLTRAFQEEGKSVVLAAADTFMDSHIGLDRQAFRINGIDADVKQQFGAIHTSSPKVTFAPSVMIIL